MTPAERTYDLELVASLRQQALRYAPVIASLGVTFNQVADRIEALSNELNTGHIQYITAPDPAYEAWLKVKGAPPQPAASSAPPGGDEQR